MLVNIGKCQVNPSYVESVRNPYRSVGCMNHQLYFEVHMQSGATYEVLDEASKVHDYFGELMYYCNNRAARDRGDYSKKPKLEKIEMKSRPKTKKEAMRTKPDLTTYEDDWDDDLTVG